MSNKKGTQDKPTLDVSEIEQSITRPDNEKNQVQSEKIRYDNADEIYE